MKTIICACAFSLAATSAFAGGYSEPVVAPEIVMTETVEAAGSDEWVVALLTFLTIGLAITGN